MGFVDLKVFIQTLTFVCLLMLHLHIITHLYCTECAFIHVYSSHVEREETMAKQVSLRKIGTAEVKSRISQATVPGL